MKITLKYGSFQRRRYFMRLFQFLHLEERVKADCDEPHRLRQAKQKSVLPERWRWLVILCFAGWRWQGFFVAWEGGGGHCCRCGDQASRFYRRRIWSGNQSSLAQIQDGI